jgi:hypothetical protein
MTHEWGAAPARSVVLMIRRRSLLSYSIQEAISFRDLRQIGNSLAPRPTLETFKNTQAP